MQRSTTQTPGTERVNVRVPPGMTAGQEIQFPNTHGFYFKVRAPPSPACALVPVPRLTPRHHAALAWGALSALGAPRSSASHRISAYLTAQHRVPSR